MNTVKNVEYKIEPSGGDKFWLVQCFINGEYRYFRQYRSAVVDEFFSGSLPPKDLGDAAVTYRFVPLDDIRWQICRDIDGELDSFVTVPVEVVDIFLTKPVIPFPLVRVGDVID